MTTAFENLPIPAHELTFEPKQLPKLRSNYGEYIDPASVGWMRPTPLDAPVEEMRKHFDEDGYVFVKAVIPREDVLDMREHYFSHLSSTGILKPGTHPRDGIFNDTADPFLHNGVGGTNLPEEMEQQRLLTAAHVTPEYLNFLESPHLRQFIRDFMSWKRETIVTRTLLRHNVPHGLSTGIHYDRIFLRAGESEFLTAWVPIGDCAADGGGLTYLENSTELGQQMEADFTERAKDFTPEERIRGFNQNMAKDGQLSHNADEFGRVEAKGRHRWLIADYEAGDVVFHNPYMIHGACKNEDKMGRIRLSTDLRFYEEGMSMDERWMGVVWEPEDGL
ncbi:MAG: hypothetical protein M1827_004064 [Pycnora praestabilis]|nr:MAG: hypothetical protein M1827_004064 [Pycnora praestabilis]